MKIVKDEKRLRKYLELYRIREMFGTEELRFRLLRFDRGEQIISPLKPMEDLLFLVKGSAHIYRLRSDAGFSPVAVNRPMTFYGDMEFATGHGSPFFVEAQSEVYCIALSLAEHEKKLREDARFLNTVLRSLGEKFSYISLMDTAGAGLEEQVLFYLDNYCEDGCIHSVKDTMMQLRCSRRQLQRVLGGLCEKGEIEHVKKGMYRRIGGAGSGN